MVSPPFHLSSVVSDPSLLFNLMAHTHVHTQTHTHGANIGCGNGSGNGSEAASGASATRGGGALHWGRCGIGVRRHRKRHRRRGGRPDHGTAKLRQKSVTVFQPRSQSSGDGGKPLRGHLTPWCGGMQQPGA